MFSVVPEDRGWLPNLCRDPFSVGFLCALEFKGSLGSWELPFRVRARLSLGGLRHRVQCNGVEM